LEKLWKINTNSNTNAIENLKQQLNIDDVIAKLLTQRNIFNYQEAKDFFRPDLKQLHNPFLMKGMDIAIDRINNAIKNNEKVLIFGDYDVDGTTSVSLVYKYLLKYLYY
jgi:single-stranded-DNA-specific exonuclease